MLLSEWQSLYYANFWLFVNQQEKKWKPLEFNERKQTEYIKSILYGQTHGRRIETMGGFYDFWLLKHKDSVLWTFSPPFSLLQYKYAWHSTSG